MHNVPQTRSHKLESVTKKKKRLEIAGTAPTETRDAEIRSLQFVNCVWESAVGSDFLFLHLENRDALLPAHTELGSEFVCLCVISY